MTTLLGLAFVAVLLGMIALSVHRVMPQGAVQIARVGAGAALVLAAGAALVTKQVAIALGLVGIALALLRPLIGAWRAAPSPGATSEVRTDALAMTLDHDSGAMDGEVLAGRFAGSRLSELSAEELQALLDEVEGDEESLTLLLAYLDRRRARSGAAGDGAGDGSGYDSGYGGADTAPLDTATMSEAEALRVLGLEPGASVEEVRAAHRRLMKRVHPDLGGSQTLATMINAAKHRLDPGRS